ncbi:hypothetical protein GCM10027612_75740 [Microbispora bryophytorum subsp. camponoti]
MGRVAGLGPDTPGPPVGSRVGVAWLRSTCGRCRYCLRGAENLCPASTYTGWDADGGYAQLLTAPAAYVYPLPEDTPAETLAPLLCAGIIGYRALARADLPPGGRLGIYGFGASAHLTAQIAIAEGATVHVMTRSPAARSSRSGWAPPPPRAAPTRRPSLWTRPSCSRRSATSCRSRWPRSTGAARSRWRGSTSPTSRC